MSATVHNASSVDAQFGTPSVTSFILNDLSETRSAQTAEVMDEDGDVISLAVYGGNRQEITGTYVWQGEDIASIGGTVAVSGLSFPANGSAVVIVTELGTRYTNTGFATGNFKAISVEGIDS